MSQHKFTEPVYTADAVVAFVKCIYCGQIGRRYKYKPETIAYYKEDHTMIPQGVIPKCSNALAEKKEAKIESETTIINPQTPSGRHEFKISPVQNNPDGVLYACACGVIALRVHGRKNMAYLSENGSRYPKPFKVCDILREKKQAGITGEWRTYTKRKSAIHDSKAEAPIVVPKPLEYSTQVVTDQVKDNIRVVTKESNDKTVLTKTANPVTTSSGNYSIVTAAQLNDAYVILNIMYEEMAKAGLRTKGREMAGRLLYSNGYREVVKEMETKYP